LRITLLAYADDPLNYSTDPTEEETEEKEDGGLSHSLSLSSLSLLALFSLFSLFSYSPDYLLLRGYEDQVIVVFVKKVNRLLSVVGYNVAGL
jgi:hypothetical protein